MSNFLNYTNTNGVDPFKGLNHIYDDSTLEELREGLIEFDLPNRLKKMFQKLEEVKTPTLSGILNGAITPIPPTGAGTIRFSGNNFFGWNGTMWKQLDN